MGLVREDDQPWAEFPTLPVDFPMSSYGEATKMTLSLLDPVIFFNVDIKRDWSTSSIPHGGYLHSLACIAAQKYMGTYQPSLNQPDLVTSHVEFVSRSAAGAARILVTPIKLGRQYSTLRVQLLQHESKSTDSRVCLEALVTQGNLVAEAQSPNASISLPVRIASSQFSVPKRADCEIWNHDSRWPAARPALWKLVLYLPPKSPASSASPTYGPSVREQWVRWASPSIGKHFTVDSLPFLADSFRPLPEAYGVVGNWYATLSYGIEVKRAPDGEGWTWLFVRVEMGEVINGRFGMEVWILDEKERLVAKSSHTTLIMGRPAEKPRALKGAKI